MASSFESRHSLSKVIQYIVDGELMPDRESPRVPLVARAGLAIVLIVCLIVLVISSSDADGGQTEQGELAFESMDTIEQQAWQLANEAVGAGSDVQQQFVVELLDFYHRVEDSDLVIFCSSGGWGGEPLATNPEGQSWLVGIGSRLTQLGYEYCTVDYVRTGSGFREGLFEFKELVAHYPSKAKKLAAQLDFLTRHVDNLKIIITGQSNGAAFANEVVRSLGDNPDVYSIQIGCPFWYQAPRAGQSLVVYHNGLMVDALVNRDIMTLLEANHTKLFIIHHVPFFTPVSWLVTRAVLVFGLHDVNLGLEAPGHKYMWEYPGVGPSIEAFIIGNFRAR